MTLRRIMGVLNNYLFGFIVVTLIYALMIRGLYAAGEHMHIGHDVVLLMVALSTVLYGLVIAVTLYIRKT